MLLAEMFPGAPNIKILLIKKSSLSYPLFSFYYIEYKNSSFIFEKITKGISRNMRRLMVESAEKNKTIIFSFFVDKNENIDYNKITETERQL